MKGNLLDSNIALLASASAGSLTSKVRRAIERGPNFLSVISYWEVLLKSMKGKLKVGDPPMWWHDTLEQLAATPLPLRPNHVTAISELPSIHQDPFDRALIAQATVEELVLITTDESIAQYADQRLHVLR